MFVTFTCKMSLRRPLIFLNLYNISCVKMLLSYFVFISKKIYLEHQRYGILLNNKKYSCDESGYKLPDALRVDLCFLLDIFQLCEFEAL